MKDIASRTLSSTRSLVHGLIGSQPDTGPEMDIKPGTSGIPKHTTSLILTSPSSSRPADAGAQPKEHYLVLLKLSPGGWEASIPDLPNVGAQGATPELAMERLAWVLHATADYELEYGNHHEPPTTIAGWITQPTVPPPQP
jgi:predicted RNase H-like HicB family nuclease